MPLRMLMRRRKGGGNPHKSCSIAVLGPWRRVGRGETEAPQLSPPPLAGPPSSSALCSDGVPSLGT